MSLLQEKKKSTSLYLSLRWPKNQPKSIDRGGKDKDARYYEGYNREHKRMRMNFNDTTTLTTRMEGRRKEVKEGRGQNPKRSKAFLIMVFVVLDRLFLN